MRARATSTTSPNTTGSRSLREGYRPARLSGAVLRARPFDGARRVLITFGAAWGGNGSIAIVLSAPMINARARRPGRATQRGTRRDFLRAGRHGSRLRARAEARHADQHACVCGNRLTSDPRALCPHRRDHRGGPVSRDRLADVGVGRFQPSGRWAIFAIKATQAACARPLLLVAAGQDQIVSTPGNRRVRGAAARWARIWCSPVARPRDPDGAGPLSRAVWAAFDAFVPGHADVRDA
jgi:hypothetical protein